MMSILGGHTVLFYCLTTGVYIFALGMGALIPVGDVTRAGAESLLFRVEMGLCLLGGGSPLWLSLIGQLMSLIWQGTPPPVVISMIPHGILVIAIGVLSGMELPVIMRLGELADAKSAVTKLLVIDYLASFIGALSFPLVLFPAMGMVRVAALLAMMNLYAVLISVPLKQNTHRFVAVSVSACLALLIFMQSDAISRWLSHYL